MSFHKKSFNIAGIQIAVAADMPFQIADKYQSFAAEHADPDVVLRLRWADKMDLRDFETVYRAQNYDILRREDEIIKIKYDFPSKQVVSWYLYQNRNHPESSTAFLCHSWEKNLLSLNPLFFFELSAFLIHYDAMILHSSLISCNGHGIIFTAPSGTGKSTQADLWHTYKKAEILNGDRSIIRRGEDGYRGYGSPYAGSSGIYRNESAPLTSIVVLRQAKENRIRKLGLREAYLCLLSEMSVSRWDKEAIARQSDWLLRLLAEVPVYRLDCLPDQGAVETLSNALGGI